MVAIGYYLEHTLWNKEAIRRIVEFDLHFTTTMP
jgi:hypothetical protein